MASSSFSSPLLLAFCFAEGMFWSRCWSSSDSFCSALFEGRVGLALHKLRHSTQKPPKENRDGGKRREGSIKRIFNTLLLNACVCFWYLKDLLLFLTFERRDKKSLFSYYQQHLVEFFLFFAFFCFGKVCYLLIINVIIYL